MTNYIREIPTTVTIHTYSVGTHFATAADVRRGSRVLYQTRNYPYGYDAQAYDDAARWAREQGHTIREVD